MVGAQTPTNVQSFEVTGGFADGVYDAVFPFVGCLAIENIANSDEAGPDSFVLLGAGQGIVVLDPNDANPLDPKPYVHSVPTACGTPTSPPNPEGMFLRCPGLVRDIEVTDADKFWAAVGTSGVVRFSIDECQPAWPRDIWMNGLSDARRLTSATIGSEQRLIVASHCETASGPQGELFLIDVNGTGSTPGPLIVDSIVTPGAPIWALDCYVAGQEQTLRVLVGTACGGMKRYDVKSTSGYAAFEQPAAPATPIWGGAQHFIRDIVIDAPHDRAYVAVYGANLPNTVGGANDNPDKGIFLVGIGADGSLVDLNATGSGWPLKPVIDLSSTNPNDYAAYYTHRIEHDPGTGLLVVALGRNIALERQYSGECEKLVACDCDVGDCFPSGATGYDPDPGAPKIWREIGGLVSYRLVEGAGQVPTATQKSTLIDFPGDTPPFRTAMDLALRTTAAGQVRVDVAADAYGYRQAEVQDLAGGNADLSPKGEYAGLESPPVQPLPLKTFDSALITDQYIYVAAESGLATFQRVESPPSDLWNPADGALLEECTGYSHVVNSGADASVLDLAEHPSIGLLFAAGTGGFRVFRNGVQYASTYPSNPWPHPDTKDTKGRCFYLTTADGFPVTETVTPRRLYTSQSVDFSNPALSSVDTGSVALWDVTRETARPLYSLPFTVERDRYAYAPQSPPAEPTKAASFAGIAAINHTENGQPIHVVFVAYGPSPIAGQETGAGLVVLKTVIDDDPLTNPIEYDIRFVKRVSAVDVAPVFDASSSKVTYDPWPGGPGPRVFVALGCNGFAAYDATDPLDPQFLDYRSDFSAITVVRGPTITSGGVTKTRGFFSSVDNGVGVIDDIEHLDTSGILMYSMPFQVGMLSLWPSSGRNRLIVPGMKGGLYHMSFSFPGS